MKKILFAFLLITTPVFAFADATSTVSTSSPQAATITIRDGYTTAFSGIVELAASTTPPVDIAPTNSTTTVPVPADSLLATLVALDATTTDFDITDLAYYSSYNSFIINCIAFPATPTTDCYNWTYAVNGTFPQVGVDHQTLHDGDVVYLFFGPPRQTTLSTTTAAVGESFTATAQSYDLTSGTYVGTPGLTLGVGTQNPDFSFTELATSTSDANGQAIFTLNATGTFAVGIQEDFYFPSASVTITEAAASTEASSTPPADNPPQSGGGGGGGISHLQLNVPNALAYLANKQRTDGSFSSSMLSDWAALAFAASDPGTARINLRNYLLAAQPLPSSVTDYERHAMALEAMGINPYTGSPTDTITPIVNAFDGTQIGDASLDNDDIFALFPLLHAGYSTSDNIIQKITAFIVSHQQQNGAWDSSVDVTAAAIQALELVPSLPDVSTAITKAEQYLHTQQQQNGGWNNSFSTSWALQAIAALNEPSSNWSPIGYTPNDYLAGLQQSDGGVEPTSSSDDTRVWATSYAIPASLGKTWDSLLQSFSKPTSNTAAGGGQVLGVATSTTLSTATTTAETATSTPPVATSTPPTATSTTPVVHIAPTSTPTHRVSKQKNTVAQTVRIATTTQTNQTAATAEGDGLITKLWHALVSFFAKIF
jgi:hypothetical protein